MIQRCMINQYSPLCDLSVLTLVAKAVTFGCKRSGVSLRYGSEIYMKVKVHQKEKGDPSVAELQEFSSCNRNS